MESNPRSLNTYQLPCSAENESVAFAESQLAEDSVYSLESSDGLVESEETVSDAGVLVQKLLPTVDYISGNNSISNGHVCNTATQETSPPLNDVETVLPKPETDSHVADTSCTCNNSKGGDKQQLVQDDCAVCVITPRKRANERITPIPKTHRHSQPWCAVEITPILVDSMKPQKCDVTSLKTPAPVGDDKINNTITDLDAPIVASEASTDDEPKGTWCSKYSRQQQLTLVSLCLVDFTCFLGMSIMAPFFPKEAGEKGMDEATVGFVFSCYALVMFIMSPIFGRILPTVGPKFLFLSGLFLSGGCTILFGILDEVSGQTFVVLCFVIRSFEALGAAAYNTASCTMVAEIFPDNIGAVFGLLETFVGLGMTVGPALGAALYALQGYKLPFLLLGGFMILMVPVNMFLLPAQPSSGVKVKPGSLRGLLRLPTVLIMSMVVLVQACAWAFLDPFLEPHLQEFSLTTETVGLIFLMLAATYGIFCPVWGWVADKWDHTSIMMITGMVLSAGALLLLGPSDLLPFLDSELWLNMVALILLGIAMAMAVIPTFQSMMDYAIDAGFEDGVSTYSVVSGLWSAAYSLGDFVGPSLGGVLVNAYLFPTAATGIAGLILAGAAVLCIYETVLWFERRKTHGTAAEKTPLLSSTPKTITSIRDAKV